jgi:hypothetical protein
MKGGEASNPFVVGRHYLITFTDPTNKDPIDAKFLETEHRTLVFTYFINNTLERLYIATDDQWRVVDDSVKNIQQINISLNKTYKLKFKGNKPDRISKVIGIRDNSYYFVDI